MSILPYVDQQALYNQWRLDLPANDPANLPLTTSEIPVYLCPLDLTRNKDSMGDSSYAPNGGVGFTRRMSNGVPDCPVSLQHAALDLDGDGSACAGISADQEDRDRFKKLGLFFLETWNVANTRRHHAIADIKDGTSQTFMIGENVRVGYDPEDEQGRFCDSTPQRAAFYIGNPCPSLSCTSGAVDYSLGNAANFRINSGLPAAEGRSSVPNSFHQGGVHMGYADGHVAFLSELIDGRVYSALASPQGMLLDGTPLAQVLVSSTDS